MVRRRWRDYRTERGRRPVKEFVEQLADEDVATIVAAMREVAVEGLIAARHLRGDLYEVRAEGADQSFRILFATEGRRGQVLLALQGFGKKTQRTPPQEIALAEQRLADWRGRARRTARR